MTVGQKKETDCATQGRIVHSQVARKAKGNRLWGGGGEGGLGRKVCGSCHLPRRLTGSEETGKTAAGGQFPFERPGKKETKTIHVFLGGDRLQVVGLKTFGGVQATLARSKKGKKLGPIRYSVRASVTKRGSFVQPKKTLYDG